MLYIDSLTKTKDHMFLLKDDTDIDNIHRSFYFFSTPNTSDSTNIFLKFAAFVISFLLSQSNYFLGIANNLSK